MALQYLLEIIRKMNPVIEVEKRDVFRDISQLDYDNSKDYRAMPYNSLNGCHSDESKLLIEVTA